MTAEIALFPKWKKDSNAYEWLQEIAGIAAVHPERFGRVVVVMEETLQNGIDTKIRSFAHGRMTMAEFIGLLNIAGSQELRDAVR